MTGTPPLPVNLSDECSRRFGKPIAEPDEPQEGDVAVEHVVELKDALRDANGRILARDKCETAQRGRYKGKQ
jgi:hypothetical protein